MAYKNISKLTLITLTLIFSTLSQAELISVDWKKSGDKLITRDTTTGLDWLDLSETNNIARDILLTKLGKNSQFSGWKYATAEQVSTLWLNGGIDLTKNAKKIVANEDPRIATMSSLLGNIMHDYDPSIYTNGVIGITVEQITADKSHYKQMGAFYFSPARRNFYHGIDSDMSEKTDRSRTDFGHYLITKSPATKTPSN